jgi:hypothetical protein
VLRQGTRQVFAINPLASSRYRDRHSVSRKKSDPGDALVLANILRTAPCPTTPIWPARSPSWPAPSRTPRGIASRSPTSSAPCCASATPPPWTPSPPGPTASAAPRLANSSNSPPPPPRQPD